MKFTGSPWDLVMAEEDEESERRKSMSNPTAIFRTKNYRVVRREGTGRYAHSTEYILEKKTADSLGGVSWQYEDAFRESMNHGGGGADVARFFEELIDQLKDSAQWCLEDPQFPTVV